MLANAQKASNTAPTLPKEDALVPRAAVLESVSRYRYYLQRRTEVQQLFERWDLDQNFALGPDELRQLIDSREHHLQHKREKGGIIVTLTPSKEDIDFILKECDHNADGQIDKSELLPALATWATLAEQKVSAQSTACVLL